MAKLSNYKGSVELASGIRPKNNGDFPLMEAHDIVVDEQGTRLDDKLSGLVVSGNGKTFEVKPKTQENIDNGYKVWTAVSATRYKVAIPQSEFGFEKPHIDDCIVNLKSGVREKAILDMLELLNGDIVIYSNLEIDCKIILKGE